MVTQVEETHLLEPTGKFDDLVICGTPKSGFTNVHESGIDDICGFYAGWGTDHPGEGLCKRHEEQPGVIDRRFSYAEVLQNPRMVEIFREQSAEEELDNIDGEIILLRSMVALVAENFGVQLSKDEDSDELQIVKNPTLLRHQAHEVVSIIRELSSAIKRKYEILAIAGQTIPRERIIQYMTQIRMVLNNTLRDYCPNCQSHIKMREEAAEALRLIGNL